MFSLKGVIHKLCFTDFMIFYPVLVTAGYICDIPLSLGMTPHFKAIQQLENTEIDVQVKEKNVTTFYK